MIINNMQHYVLSVLRLCAQYYVNIQRAPILFRQTCVMSSRTTLS